MVAQYKIKYPGKIFIGVVRGRWSEALDDPSLNNAVPDPCQAWLSATSAFVSSRCIFVHRFIGSRHQYVLERLVGQIKMEAVGLVLGVIPLVISALEYYAEGVHKRWRYKRELSSLKRILDAEFVRYLNTCEELLSGIVPNATLAALLDFPGGPGCE